jgi:hypothetical protein
VCWYLAGPPWHIERHHRPIEWHEQLLLGPMQAMSKGFLPFIGPAATPYGPGAEILTYALTRGGGAFDLVSYRRAWAVQNFLAMLAVGVAAYWWLGLVPAIAVTMLATIYSPFAFYYAMTDGTWAGFYGWANPLRYLAPLVVVPALGLAALHVNGRWRSSFVLGIAWGIGAFLAQESLTTTFIAVVLLLAVLQLTGTITVARTVSTGGGFIAGFTVTVVPVLLFYALHDAAGAFVRTYFFFARAVSLGYSNMWWREVASSDRFSYYLSAPFFLGCAVCALWRPSLVFVSPLDRRRVLFISFVLVQLVCYQTALLRSDSTHVMNTMIALPFVLVLGVMEVPVWLAAGRRRWAVRATFAAAALVVYPAVRLAAANPARFTTPAKRFRADVSRPPAPTDTGGSVAFSRATPLLADEPLLVSDDTVSMREFLRFADDVHSIVGSRKTYALRIGWTASGGLIAFMADLIPSAHPLGDDILSLSDAMRAEIADDMRTHPGEYQAFIGPSLESIEARAFLAAHPAAITHRRKLGEATVYILLATQ